MTRREQTVGKSGESLAANTLKSIGIEMVEKIGTPVRLIPSRCPGAYKVIWGDKVSGDHRGILADGRSVLAETKTILDHNLQWSDLREHQPERLQEHTDLHGLSLLIWVHSSGVYVMEWPVPGFEKGKSIKVDEAEIHDSRTRRMILDHKNS